MWFVWFILFVRLSDGMCVLLSFHFISSPLLVVWSPTYSKAVGLDRTNGREEEEEEQRRMEDDGSILLFLFNLSPHTTKKRRKKDKSKTTSMDPANQFLTTVYSVPTTHWDPTQPAESSSMKPT